MRKQAVVLAGTIVAVLAGAACQPLPPPGGVPTRYVAVSGADVGACTVAASPCRTIDYAVSQASAGDTVKVGPGAYPEMVKVDKALNFVGPNAGRSAGVVTVPRAPEAVVQGFRSPSATPHPAADMAFSVTIDGFTIDPQGDAALLAAGGRHLVSLFGGPKVSVRNNRFNGGPYDPTCTYTCSTMADAAFLVQSGTFDLTANSFVNFRRPIDISQNDPAHPIVAGTIAGNRFSHVTYRAIWLREGANTNTSPGITVKGNSIDATGFDSTDNPAGIVITTGGNTITKNTITGFGPAVFDQVCDSGNNPSNVPNRFTDNTFTHNRDGIEYFVVDSTQCGPADAVIRDNSFVANTGYGVKWYVLDGLNPPPTQLDARCNWWGASTGPGTAGADKVTGSVLTDPWKTSAHSACVVS